MSLADLLKPGPPVFHLTTAATSTLGAAVAALTTTRASVVARRVRGTRCHTVEAFFDELAAVLQFPAYFGANWAALSDVLTDLGWLPADEYLLVFEDADLLLADEQPDALGFALQTFADAAAELAPLPCQFLLQAAGDGRVAQALISKGTPLGVFAL